LGEARPAEAAALIGAEGDVLEAAVLTAPWDGPLRKPGWRHTRWGVMRLAPRADVCA
jgi:hypothetical protein